MTRRRHRGAAERPGRLTRPQGRAATLRVAEGWIKIGPYGGEPMSHTAVLIKWLMLIAGPRQPRAKRPSKKRMTNGRSRQQGRRRGVGAMYTEDAYMPP